MTALPAWRKLRRYSLVPSSGWGARREDLLGLCPHNDRRDVRGIDRRVEKLRTGELRKVHQLVADFLDFSANLLPGFHPQLDGLARVLLQNAQDRVARLQVDFALGEKSGASEGDDESNEKGRAFHKNCFAQEPGALRAK
jgi:hypothetical protein